VTPEEVQDLLVEASAFDGRMVNEDVVAAWQRILRNVRADQAVQAMRHHFATEDRRLMPVHIVQGVKKIRAELMVGYQGPGLAREIPAVDPDQVLKYLAEGLRQRELAGDGVPGSQVPQLVRAIGRMPRGILVRETTPMVVPCPDEDCRALVGRQCRTRRGDTRAAHGARIDAFEAWKTERDSA